MLGVMHDRTAIITGAGAGIGRGLARVFAHAGANVVVVDRDAAAARATLDVIEAAGGRGLVVAADVTARAEMERMAQAALDQFGRIDVLCANAGIFPQAALDTMTEADWDHVQAVNVKGALFAVQACLPQMRRQHYGRIVLTSSITGPITGFPGWSHYGASKAALLGFMRTAAIEVARDGITVNAVLPGNIRTEGLANTGADYIRRMEQSIPMGELGTPEDIAYAALFLASEQARYITGQTLVIDGGQVLPESILALES